MKKKILFVVAGYPGIGMGHAVRVSDLYKSFKRYNVTVLCSSDSLNAFKFLQQAGIQNLLLQDELIPISEYVRTIRPDMVINDVLNTTQEYIQSIKQDGIKVVSLEDVGDGAAYTDLTVNAIYSSSAHSNILSGHRYFDLRDEFIVADKAVIKPEVNKILLSFGGEDPSNLTLRFLQLLAPCEFLNNVTLEIITGAAYRYGVELEQAINLLNKQNIVWFKNISGNMSKHMLSSDIVICSNGRTVYELAALGLPSIVVSANPRETTHNFADVAKFVNLGLYSSAHDAEVIGAVKTLMQLEQRMKIHKSALAVDLSHGKKRLVSAISAILYRESSVKVIDVAA